MGDFNNKKINRILTIVIVVLTIIIVLLLFKGCSKNDENIPNERKVNVFEIKGDTNYNCGCEKCENSNITDDDKNKDQNKNSNNETKDVIKEINDNTCAEVDIKSLDNEKVWKDNEQLSIFNDSTYVVNGKIAPESSGTYEFVIKNSTSYNVKYDIEFDETNNYNINMKYKLKKNNEYVIREWVAYSQLKQENIELNSNSNDTYYLEWKWISSSNDNTIGTNIKSKYGVSINIRAVQTND